MKRYNKLPKDYSPVLSHVFDFSDWNTLYPSQYLASTASLGDMIFPESIKYLSSHPAPVVYPSCRINDLLYYFRSFSDPLHVSLSYIVQDCHVNHKEFVTLLYQPRIFIRYLLVPYFSCPRHEGLDLVTIFLSDFLRGRSHSLLIGGYSRYICRMSFSSLNLDLPIALKYTLYFPQRKNTISFAD